MKKILLVILIIFICGVILFASGLLSFKKDNNTNNTTNNTTKNTTNITNLTNNSSNKSRTDSNNQNSLEHTQSKSDSNDAPSDIYSRWDTDGDGKISSSENDVHDQALGQGKYYTGHENMRDSISTYP